MSIEAALFAFLRERSAQIGERFDMEMFQQLKAQDPEQFDDEIVQMRCAIEAFEAAKTAEQADDCRTAFIKWSKYLYRPTYDADWETWQDCWKLRPNNP